MRLKSSWRTMKTSAHTMERRPKPIISSWAKAASPAAATTP